MDHSCKSLVTNSFFEIIIITLSILFGFLFTLIGYPLLLILLLYRSSVIFLSKWKNNTWIPVNILSSVHALDACRDEKIWTYGFCFEVDKSFDYKGWMKRTQEFLERNKRPELKCFLYRWFGTYFLVKCKHFRFEDVVLVDHTNLPLNKVHQYLLDFTTESFTKSRPLWQIGIFPNLKTDVCVISLKAHHCLADALSLMSFLADLCDSDPVLEQKFKLAMDNITTKLNPKRYFYSNLLIALEFVFISPFQAVYNLLHSIENNMWSSAVCTGPLLQMRHVLDVNHLKEISTGLQTNLLTLFAAALTGAMREEMKARGHSISQNCSFHFMLPLPGHPHERKLTNYATGSILSLPTGNGNRLKRLTTIAQRFETNRRPALMLFFHVFETFGALCASILRQLPDQRPRYIGTGGWSNLVCFVADRKLMGNSMSNLSTLIDPPVPGIPLALLSVTCNNELVLNFYMDAGIISGETGLKQFVARIEHEITCYTKLTISHV